MLSGNDAPKLRVVAKRHIRNVHDGRWHVHSPEVRGLIQNEFSAWLVVQINGQGVRGVPGEDWKQIDESDRYRTFIDDNTVVNYGNYFLIFTTIFFSLPKQDYFDILRIF